MKFTLLAFGLIVCLTVFGQHLKPGFDKQEYRTDEGIRPIR
jgi:hypothetical protein